jgi:hypothetical protein
MNERDNILVNKVKPLWFRVGSFMKNQCRSIESMSTCMLKTQDEDDDVGDVGE